MSGPAVDIPPPVVSIPSMPWDEQFLTLFRRCVDEYRSGNSDFGSYYSPEDLEFLRSIGYKPRELFDFVEDLVDEGVPSEPAALLVAAARRDYLHAEHVLNRGLLGVGEFFWNLILLSGPLALPWLLAGCAALLFGGEAPRLRPLLGMYSLHSLL